MPLNVRLHRSQIRLAVQLDGETMKHVTLHTDGACSGNPGPGGYRQPCSSSASIATSSAAASALTTNNRMELLAVIEGLEIVEAALFSHRL